MLNCCGDVAGGFENMLLPGIAFEGWQWGHGFCCGVYCDGPGMPTSGKTESEKTEKSAAGNDVWQAAQLVLSPDDRMPSVMIAVCLSTSPIVISFQTAKICIQLADFFQDFKGLFRLSPSPSSIGNLQKKLLHFERAQKPLKAYKTAFYGGRFSFSHGNQVNRRNVPFSLILGVSYVIANEMKQSHGSLEIATPAH